MRKLVYGFLHAFLGAYSNYDSILAVSVRYWALNYGVTREIGVVGSRGHRKRPRSIDHIRFTFRPSILLKVLLCMWFPRQNEIFVENPNFSYTALHSTPPFCPSEYFHTVWKAALECRRWKSLVCFVISTEYRCVTDRRTDILRQHSQRYA